jgi:hypothetical protein
MDDSPSLFYITIHRPLFLAHQCNKKAEPLLQIMKQFGKRMLNQVGVSPITSSIGQLCDVPTLKVVGWKAVISTR